MCIYHEVGTFLAVNAAFATAGATGSDTLYLYESVTGKYLNGKTVECYGSNTFIYTIESNPTTGDIFLGGASLCNFLSYS
jgi:hypothetical protein